MYRTSLIVVVVLIAAILVRAATLPDDFHVQRATSIKALPEKSLALINDWHRWDSWSPWEKMNPARQRTFSGAAAGKGAGYGWQGNFRVGEGRMEIAATSLSKVMIKLDFIKPIEGHNTAEFTLEPSGGATNVTWNMDGPGAYLAKVIAVLVSMDN